MQQLNSKNYDSVSVQLRNQDDLIIMDVNRGTKLMEYLVTDHKTAHVGITDREGNKVIVRTTDILRVEPVMKTPEVKDYV